MKYRHNPFTNNVYCHRTPTKYRYTKAVFAWLVGAKRAKKDGVQLYIYRCQCGGWHLTHRNWHGSIRIETRATRMAAVQINVSAELKGVA